MKQIITVLMAIALTACNFSGFEPPRETNTWHLPDVGDKEYTNKEALKRAALEYIARSHEAMEECGIDLNVGSTTSVKESLCMEDKGWRNSDGWTCERDIYKDNDICQQWRAAASHSHDK